MASSLKVTPEQLTAAASEFSTQGSTISNLTSEMTSLVTGLSSNWEGEASAAYVSRFQGLEDDIQKLIKMVQEHASDLETIARNFAQNEQAIQTEIQSLSSDVIV